MDYDFLSPQDNSLKFSQNPAIDNIIRSGADFAGNQFQAMLYWFPEDNKIENVFYQHFNPTVSSKLVYNKESSNFNRPNPTANAIDGKLDYDTKYKQAILSKEGFLVRFANIKLPTIKNETYTIKVGMHTIEKVKTTKSMTPQANFSFRLDANLEWLDFFNKAAGNYSTLTQNTNNELTDWRQNFSQVTKFFTPGNVFSNHRLCLFIHEGCFDYTYQMYRFKNDYQKMKHHIPFSYMFQDVRFLGPGNISYDSASGGTQEVSVDFIYKRLRKIRVLDSGVIELV